MEVAVVVEIAVAAGCFKAHAADNSKRMDVGEGVAVEVGSAGIAAVDSTAAVDAQTAPGSKSARTLGEERSSSKVRLPVVAVHLLLLLWRSLSTVARC